MEDEDESYSIPSEGEGININTSRPACPSSFVPVDDHRLDDCSDMDRALPIDNIQRKGTDKFKRPALLKLNR